MRGALGVLEVAPNSHPSCCLCRTAQGQSKPSGLCRHVSSGLPLPFLSGVQWGAAQTPHWEECCSLTRKKKAGVRSASLVRPFTLPALTTPMSQTFAKLRFPQNQP